MIFFIKFWKEGDVSRSKEYILDIRTPFEGMEACKHKDEKGVEHDCTRVIYPTKFITLKGTPLEVMEKIRNATIASTLLVDLYAAGYTIKEFMEQNESINGLKI